MLICNLSTKNTTYLMQSQGLKSRNDFIIQESFRIDSIKTFVLFKICSTIRVTVFGDFSPIGRFFYNGQIFIDRSSPCFGNAFFLGKSFALMLTNNGFD
jgi:hypothetical protein